MATWLWALILLWVLPPHDGADAGAEQEWERSIAALRASEGLSASVIGFVHTPSPQYAQYEAIIASGDGPRFRSMVRDDHPVVRCIGLMALAQTKGKDAVPTLRRHLTDPAKVHYQVYDIGGSLTVGQFAWRLLYSPNTLDVEKGHRQRTLLSETEQIELPISILAEDATIPVREGASSSLISTVRRRRLTLDLPTLRPYVPSLEDWQIVKAVGRMKPLKMPRAFLIACVEDDDLEPTARFAAASALTRHSDMEAERALRVYREPLNRLDDARWGDLLIENLNARRTHERRMAPLRARRYRRRPEFTREYIVRALTCDHPLALDDLTDFPGSTAPLLYDEARPIIAASIIAISANLERSHQPWNTYSDAAFKLDIYLRHLDWLLPQLELVRAVDAPFTDAECAEIRRNISPLLKAYTLPGQPDAN